MMRRILLLDDEQNVLSALKRSFRSIAHQDLLRIDTYNAPEEALTHLQDTAYDFIVSDYHMPSMNGIEFLTLAKAIQPDAVRMMLSASAEFKTILGAINEAEAFRYIAKPWTQEELTDTYQAALQKRDQILEDRRLADELRVQRGQLSPQEEAMRRLEESEPGITKVKWGADGSVMLD
ncbi:response regulator [Undibacterium rugosum]|nr:response regulator [Undibacterium rugosum]MBR7778707.1 response regulator [Undibacterium rugosum]